MLENRLKLRVSFYPDWGGLAKDVAVAACAVSLAVCCSYVAQYGSIRHGTLLWFLASIGFAGRLRGCAAGLLAIIFGTFVGSYLFFTPRGHFLPTKNSDAYLIIFFMAVGTIISVIAGRYRTLSRRAQSANTELNRQLKLSHERELRHTAIVDGVFDYGIFNLSPDSTVVSWNAGAEQLTGYTAEEIVGRNANELLVPSERAAEGRLSERVRKATETGRWSGNLQCLKKDGKTYVANATLSKLADSEGGLLGFVIIVYDITARLRAEKELNYQLGLNRAITDNAADALFMVNQRGRVTFMNPAASRLLGYSTGELLGESLHEKTHRAVPTDECPKCNAYKNGNVLTGYETALTHKDGSLVPVSCSVSPITKDGICEGAVLVIHNMTEQKRVQERLQKAKEAAEAASEAKDQFLAILSHELRTPLTPVHASLDAMLRFGEIPPEMVEEIEMIHRNVNMEIALIDDLLDVTRVSRGKLALKKTTIQIHDLINNAIRVCDHDIQAKSLRLTKALKAKRVYVNADAGRIQQIVWNLLKNSIKFTGAEGDILIRTSDEGEMIRIDVIDTGEGIPSDVIPRLFTPFEQGDRSVGSTSGGLGLGLSICKMLSEMHGGTITCESEGRYRGATFTVRLPTVSAPAALERALSPQPIPLPTGGRLLLVEDHEDTRNMIGKLLRREGFTVHMAVNVASAVEFLSSHRDEVDLLLSDIGLPDGTGHMIMEQLGADYIPAIALTGFGQEDDVQRSAEVGFLRHVTKPINVKSLSTVIREVLVETQTLGKEEMTHV